MARVALGAGAFSLTLAGLTAGVAAPALLKAPLVSSTSAEAVGPAVRIDSKTGRQQEGTFTQYRAVGTKVCQQKWCGVGSPMGDEGTAVYEAYSESSFVPAGTSTRVELTKTIVTQAFDRSTGEGRPEFRGDATRSEAHAFQLPFGVEKKTYQLYDALTRQAFPLTYKGEKKVAGLDVYEFQQVVPPTNTGPMPGTRAVPGVWVGEPKSAGVMANQWVEDRDKRVWVEPVTGRIVGGSSNTHVWAKTADGRTVDLLRVDGATSTKASLARAVADVRDARRSAVAVQRGPWLLGGLGLFLLGLGGRLLRGRVAAASSPTGVPAATALPDVSGVLPAPRREAPVETDLRT